MGHRKQARRTELVAAAVGNAAAVCWCEDTSSSTKRQEDKERLGQAMRLCLGLRRGSNGSNGERSLQVRSWARQARRALEGRREGTKEGTVKARLVRRARCDTQMDGRERGSTCSAEPAWENADEAGRSQSRLPPGGCRRGGRDGGVVVEVEERVLVVEASAHSQWRGEAGRRANHTG